MEQKDVKNIKFKSLQVLQVDVNSRDVLDSWSMTGEVQLLEEQHWAQTSDGCMEAFKGSNRVQTTLAGPF